MDDTYEYCEVMHKRCYSKQDAGYTVNFAKKHKSNRRTPTGKVPIRYYLCQFCNKYHLTSENKRYHQKRRMKDIYK